MSMLFLLFLSLLLEVLLFSVGKKLDSFGTRNDFLIELLRKFQMKKAWDLAKVG